MNVFHNLIIPFFCGFALTLLKLIADQKLLSFDESNDIALDLVLVAVGALGALYVNRGAVEATIDAGVGDAVLAAILLYVRFRRTHLAQASAGVPPRIAPVSGILQLILGAGAVTWTITAF